eukprot:SAG31_NODE_664_length_12996_cov_4.853997_12_plen_329_part_00
MDAVGSPKMGSLELGYTEFLPHAQAVLSGLVKMGFYNIFVVCHHQGDGGQQALCMKLAAANLGLEIPNAEHPHWWGELSPDDLRPRSPSIQIVTTTVGLRNMSDESYAQKYDFVGHGGFYETAAILGLYPQAVDLSEIDPNKHSDLPWFSKPAFGDGPDCGDGKRASSADATTEFGTRMVDAWAASLAAEVQRRSGATISAADEEALFRGSVEPQPGRRVHCPGARQLDQMRPAEIQAAAAAGEEQELRHTRVCCHLHVLLTHPPSVDLLLLLICSRLLSMGTLASVESSMSPWLQVRQSFFLSVDLKTMAITCHVESILSVLEGSPN